MAEAETSMAGMASASTERAWLDARTFITQEVGTIKKLGMRNSRKVVIFNDAEYKRVMGKAKTKRHPRCVTLSVPSKETNVIEVVHAFEHPTCPIESSRSSPSLMRGQRHWSWLGKSMCTASKLVIS